MKKILLATSALVLSAGVAAAEVTLSGDARMGIVDNGGAAGAQFTSRARVKFTLSGESDSGFTFGASFRAHDAVAAAGNTAMNAGSVFISGAFGTITFGDNDSAANQMVGHVSGVGLTGLGDHNELGYLGHTDTSVSYAHTVGGVAFAISTSQTNTDDAVSVGAKYSTDMFTVALGYEDNAVAKHAALGVSGTFSGATVKMVATDVTGGANTGLALSLDYTTGATTLTAYGSKQTNGARSAGIGASYDLGGGASLVGGLVKTGTGAGATKADLGLSFSF